MYAIKLHRKCRHKVESILKKNKVGSRDRGEILSIMEQLAQEHETLERFTKNLEEAVRMCVSDDMYAVIQSTALSIMINQDREQMPWLKEITKEASAFTIQIKK